MMRDYQLVQNESLRSRVYTSERKLVLLDRYKEQAYRIAKRNNTTKNTLMFIALCDSSELTREQHIRLLENAVKNKNLEGI